MRRLVAFVAVALSALVFFAPAASAHATLTDTSPSNGAKLARSPKQITLSFTEGVTASSGSLKLFNGEGRSIPVGSASHIDGNKSVIGFAPPRLAEGGYVVTWLVVSEDSHPVQGAFTFTVGDAEAIDDASVASLLQQRRGSQIVRWSYSKSRVAAFASMLFVIGGIAFVLLVWPEGRSDPRVRRALVIGLGLLLASSLANLLLQGVYGSGLGLGSVLDATVIGDVVITRFGQVYIARFVLLAVASALFAVFLRAAPLPRWWPWLGGVVAVAILATPGLAGHAAVGSYEPYALVADVVHVGAASLWLGGLAFLTLFVLPRRTDDLKALVRRYSEVAFWAVCVLVATGVFQAWRQVGSVDALTSTWYGQLLIAKTALVAAMLGFAWLSRRATHAKWSPNTASRVRRTVGVETLIAVGVLVATSLLVNAVPAKTVAAAPQSGELTSATLLVDYTLAPGRTGSNTIHLYTLTKAGQPKSVEEMTLRLSLPGHGIEDIPVKLEVAGPGHYQALDVSLPIKGRWRMDVVARTSEIDQEVFTGTVDIR